MKRLYMLVEGQTEEKFVTDILGPYLSTKGIVTMKPVITWTSRDTKTGAKCKGGVKRKDGWDRVRGQLVKLMKENIGPDSLFSTLFDFYGFPQDTPHAVFTGSHEVDVRALEDGIFNDVKQQVNVWPLRFVPVILLHEFETFIFADPQSLDWEFIEDGDQKKIDQLKKELKQCGSPEAVNNGEETAPSKRIMKQFKSYRKVNQGNSVVSHIGIEKLLGSCPHFKDRIDALAAMAQQ